MSNIIGFNITPDSGSSLRKMLKYKLEPHLEDFEAISVGASKVCMGEKHLVFPHLSSSSSSSSSFSSVTGVQFGASHGSYGR